MTLFRCYYPILWLTTWKNWDSKLANDQNNTERVILLFLLYPRTSRNSCYLLFLLHGHEIKKTFHAPRTPHTHYFLYLFTFKTHRSLLFFYANFMPIFAHTLLCLLPDKWLITGTRILLVRSIFIFIDTQGKLSYCLRNFIWKKF